MGVSWRFKSIVNLAREITWQHYTCGPWRHHEWQQFMMTIKESSRAHLTLVHVFHAYASVDKPWVAHSLSLVSPTWYGRVSSNSATDEASKFVRPQKIPYAPVHNSKLAHSDPTGAGLNRHRQGLPPWSFEFQIKPLPFLSIQYSPFSPNCPAQSPIMPFYQLFKFSTFQSWTRVYKALNLMSETYHSTSTRVLSAKHSTTNGFSTMIGSRWYTKGIMNSRVSFNSSNINAPINNNLRTVIK
jgi:hypothetical protein